MKIRNIKILFKPQPTYTLLQDVCEDYELAEFIRTVAVDGIEWAGYGLKGFPTQLRSVLELV